MATPVVWRPRKSPPPRQPWRTGPGLRMTRKVWAFVTAHPNASVREISDQLGFSSTSGAFYHLRILEHAGVIEQDRAIARGRRIVVPFWSVETRHDRA